jgi:hypothetical protein
MVENVSDDSNPLRRFGRVLRKGGSDERPNPHVSRLALNLYLAAQTDARYALQHYTSSDPQEKRLAAIAMGASVEYIIRCALAVDDPLLLAEGSRASALLSRANRALAPLRIADVRSVTTKNAADILQLLYPTLKISREVEQVLHVRNAAAHMALVDDAESSAQIANLVSIARLVLGSIDVDLKYFWGTLHELATTIEDSNASALRVRVSAKFAAARARLSVLVGSLDGQERERVLSALELRGRDIVHLSDQLVELVECPVCAREGHASYDEDQGEPELGPDGEWHVEIYGSLNQFECPVCGLILEWHDLAAIDTEIPGETSRLERAEDPYIGWEPDEDDHRGR